MIGCFTILCQRRRVSSQPGGNEGMPQVFAKLYEGGGGAFRLLQMSRGRGCLRDPLEARRRLPVQRCTLLRAGVGHPSPFSTRVPEVLDGSMLPSAVMTTRNTRPRKICQFQLINCCLFVLGASTAPTS